MTNISVVYHSGKGHTERQARRIGAGAEKSGASEFKVISVVDMDDASWNFLDESAAIIFGSPTYMGSVSAEFKTFMDKTSKRWLVQKWRNKLAAGFTNSATPSGDKMNTLVQLTVFAAQHSMVWVGLDVMPGLDEQTGHKLNRLGGFLGAMAESENLPPEQTPCEPDLLTAERLGQRVTEFAKRIAV